MACYFHGVFNSYLNLGTSKDLKPERGSISLWFNVHGLMGQGKGVDSNPFIRTRSDTDDQCNQSFYLGFDLNTRRVNGSCCNSCAAATTVYSQREILLAKWYHAVLTYDDDWIQLYLNGDLQYKMPKNFKSKFLNGDSVVIGNVYGKKNIRYFLGCIDDISIYNRVLSQNEVDQLYDDPNPNKFIVVVKWLCLVLLALGIILIIVLLIRQRIASILQREKEKNQMLNHWYEMENRVLAAQMDPHFIFNSLNTIQQFIIMHEEEKAQSYLSKFSRLLRKILESNSKEKFNLREEIEIVEKYLEVESLRFNNVFSYKITLKDVAHPENVFIPNFLIQPLVENALWHGLLPKEGNKQLDVVFEKKDDKTLLCTIEDNGVGRKKTAVTDGEKKKSFAINFIEQRLLLMSKMYAHKYQIDIFDKVDPDYQSLGTRVVITIPIINEV
jgi:two-component sensor histidine kinase